MIPSVGLREMGKEGTRIPGNTRKKRGERKRMSDINYNNNNKKTKKKKETYNREKEEKESNRKTRTRLMKT